MNIADKVNAIYEATKKISSGTSIKIPTIYLYAYVFGKAYEYQGYAKSTTNNYVEIDVVGFKTLSYQSITGDSKINIIITTKDGTTLNTTLLPKKNLDISNANLIRISINKELSASWSRGEQGSNPSSYTEAAVIISNLVLDK